MTDRKAAVAYCLTFADVYEDYPFSDKNWCVIRHCSNRKVFAWIFDKDEHTWINVKCDSEWRDLWRKAYKSVIPAYHLNKEHWNSIILDGTVPKKEIQRMIGESYDLTNKKEKKHEQKVRNDMSLTETSRYMSLILRHKPETIGITLDEHGWADVDELIKGIAKTKFFNRNILEEIVRTDNKQRYSFNEEKTKIRANQGHSIPVDVELEQKTPPEYLWHGTGQKYVSSIDKQGLLPRSRLYVHLSTDEKTAVTVGLRHGIPVIYKVHSKQMAEDGYKFYCSVNGVWLTKEVPVKYMEKIKKY